MEKNITQFISHKNQILLWKTLTQSILFNKLPPDERTGWFKNIIGYIYYERNTIFFDTDELVTLNKKAIYFILNELKSINERIEKEILYLPESDRRELIDEPLNIPINTPINNFTNTSTNTHNTINSPTPIHNTPYFTNLSIEDEYPNKTVIKKELYDKNATLFDMRQKEFNDLIANNTPPQIDFRIKEMDEPMEDLSILIERYVKERNEL
jgi:hypothetical protein